MRVAIAAVLGALAVGAANLAQGFEGKVIGITDGDTLTVLDRQQPMRVRLVGIDAPEQGQPHGRRAKESLSELAFGKLAVVDRRGRDAYGRVLGRVRVAGVELNTEQLRRGYAWVFRRYSSDAAMIALEDEARAARRELERKLP
jgi:micrococcal nuclease